VTLPDHTPWHPIMHGAELRGSWRPVRTAGAVRRRPNLPAHSKHASVRPPSSLIKEPGSGVGLQMSGACCFWHSISRT
jgi:hypothetical protein